MSELFYGLWTIAFFVAYAFMPLPYAPSNIKFLGSISYELYLCQGIGFVLIPVTWNPWLILMSILLIDILASVLCKRVGIFITKY